MNNLLISPDNDDLKEKEMSKDINTFYEQDITPDIESLFALASSSLNDKINSLKSSDESLWGVIAKKLKVDWTYHSNSLEGSTLTLGETFFFISEGLTVEGKPFKDFLDAKNHVEAIDYLYEIISNQRDISEYVIKETNALLLSGVTYTVAQNSQGEKVKKKAGSGRVQETPQPCFASGRNHPLVC